MHRALLSQTSKFTTTFMRGSPPGPGPPGAYRRCLARTPVAARSGGCGPASAAGAGQRARIERAGDPLRHEDGLLVEDRAEHLAVEQAVHERGVVGPGDLAVDDDHVDARGVALALAVHRPVQVPPRVRERVD